MLVCLLVHLLVHLLAHLLVSLSWLSLFSIERSLCLRLITQTQPSDQKPSTASAPCW
jgi:hypothetical protein